MGGHVMGAILLSSFCATISVCAAIYSFTTWKKVRAALEAITEAECPSLETTVDGSPEWGRTVTIIHSCLDDWHKDQLRKQAHSKSQRAM